MTAGVGPVLVGTDFSEGSGQALAEARRLAALLGTRVRVVHVLDGGGVVGWGETGRAGMWLRRVGLEAHELVLRHGSAWVELSRYASEAAPALLVVGSHGQSGYQPLAIGSVAMRLAVHARCPVVLISPRVVQQEQESVDAVRDSAAAGVRQLPDESQWTGDTR